MKSRAVALISVVLVLALAQNRALGDVWKVDLSGDWRFCAGDDVRWAEPSFDDSDWEELYAPALWDGQGYEDYDGFGWYRKRFFVPEYLKGKQFVFEHGGVDDDDWVYVNGKKIGEGKGCYKPRQYVIPPGTIRVGAENLIAVRIYDGAMGGGLAVAPIEVREMTLKDRIEIAALELSGAYGEEIVSLRLAVANKESVPAQLQGSYDIFDPFGRSRASGSLDLTLDPDETLTKEIRFRGGDSAEYRVQLALSDNGQSMELFRYVAADAKLKTRGILNLSGPWEMLAPADDQLVFPPTDEWQDVQIPTRGWGGWPGRNHRAWFRRHVALPEDMKGKRLKLRFEAVAHHAQVYVNGQKLAEHLGGFEPFEVDITQVARWDGPNEILVGVTDWVVGLVEAFEEPPDPADRPKDAMLIPYGTRPPSRRGIWDDVYLLAHNDVIVSDVFPMTSVREKEMRLQLQLRNEGTDAREVRIENEVFDGDAQVLSLPAQSVSLAPGEARILEMAQNWDTPRLWWPDDPHLYRLCTRLISDGQVLDELNTRFGFRECWIEGIDYRLNGVVFKLRGLVCPPSGATREEIREYYLRAKESNFSLVRFHMQPRAHHYYEIADEVGICVKDESAFYCAADVYALADDRLWENLAAHVEGMVLRARNHPSLCIWSVENEILHCGGVREPQAGARIFELGKIIRALDPSRPIEYEGDGDLEGRAETVNIHYPREFGCHSHNLWPDDAYWLGKEGNDRWPRDLVWRKDKPLIMGEFCYYPYSRPPGGVSVFTGDEAYRSKEHEFKAHLQGVKFLCDGCRRLGVAGLNPWVRDWRYALECLKPIAVTFREYDEHFFAGQTVTRSLMVHNDTLETRRLNLACSVSDGRGTVQNQELELDLEPGTMRDVPFSWQMPHVRERQDLTLDVRILAGSDTVFQEKRRFSAFPLRPVSAPAQLTIALYDPVGETSGTLQTVGVAVTLLGDLSTLDNSTCGLLLIGKDALASEGFAPHADRIRAFVANGGKVFCFEQKEHPKWLPVALRVDAAHASTIAFIRRASHPLLANVRNDDVKFWRGDHLVSRADFLKPTTGAFGILVEAGGLGGLRWSPLVEIPHGEGFYIVSQLLLTAKLQDEPVARQLLQNLFDYAASYHPAPPAKTAVVASQDAALKESLAAIGVVCDDLSDGFNAAELSQYGLLIVGRDDPALGNADKLKAFVAAGGKVMIHCPTAEAEASLKALVPGVKAVKRCRPKGKLLKRRDDGLMEGLSNSDLFWYRQDCWYRNWEGRGTGLIQNPANWQIELEKGAGVVFTRPAAVVSVPHGEGVFVINTIRWDDADDAVAEKASRIASTLLFNLGAPFEQEGTE